MVVSEADGFEVRKYGGLEAFASAAGIVRAAKNAMDAGFGGELAEYDPEAFTAEDIAELARRGNLACRQIYRRVGKLLGLATANLISLFNPQVVVFGGELAAAADLFWDELTQTAVARCLPLSGRRIRIRLSGLGADANLYGAAYLAWQAADQRTNVPGVAHTPAVLIGKARGKRPSSTK
jgi:glucokinase